MNEENYKLYLDEYNSEAIAQIYNNEELKEAEMSLLQKGYIITDVFQVETTLYIKLSVGGIL